MYLLRMKKYGLIVFLLICLFSGQLVAQENLMKHTVLKEETVLSIAQKYKVTPNDLYQLNPDLVNGIQENQIIIIPSSAVVKSQQLPKKEVVEVEEKKQDVIYYTVQPGETKYGLSKRFKISIAQLEQQNPHIVMGLQSEHKLEIRGGNDSKPIQKEGQSASAINQNNRYEIYTVLPNETLYGISKRHGITVPQLESINQDYLSGILKSGQLLRVPSQIKQQVATENANYHLVQAGETKFGLSKRYGVSIEELERNNPQIVRMLQTGQQVVIYNSKSNSSEVKQEVVSEEVKEKQETVKQETVIEKVEPKKPAITAPKNEPSDWVDYEIQPKQTLYGLSKMTGLTKEKLIEKNPNLEIGVQAGMIIKIPGDKITAELASAYKIPTVVEEVKEESKSTTEKPIVKSIPSVEVKGLLKTINKVESKEVALLMPFSMEKWTAYTNDTAATKEKIGDYDFYIGAIMAIDSLRKMNVLVEVKTVELSVNKENKIDASLLKKNKIENSKAIFLFSEGLNAEKISEFASKETIPLLINQKNEVEKSYASTYVGIPSKNIFSKMMLAYFAGKSGNVIVVSDEENANKTEFIQNHYPKARFITVSDKGVIEAEALQNELIHNRKNYVVLNTEKTGLILNTTTILLKESTTYDIQLALLQPKEAITGEGLSDMRFKALKMLYPSFSKRTNQADINRFKAAFQKKYNAQPSEQVFQGFDLTYDAIIRLFQDASFEATAKDEITEQLLFTFQYVINPEGGYSNQGGYILQYDVDSDSKLAN